METLLYTVFMPKVNNTSTVFITEFRVLNTDENVRY